MAGVSLPPPHHRLVAILERVQSGLLGATVSSFGITGLYITFVFGIGRFLRLSTSNMRMRIPFDDLPNTSRLVALVQVPPSPHSALKWQLSDVAV